MAIKFNRSQTFATGGTVTSAALHNLTDGTDIYPALITDQSNLATISTADKLLIADTDDTINAKSTTVQNLFDQAFSGGTYTALNLTGALTFGTATGNRTVSTSATITTGTIPNLTAGTTTSTAATITTGTIPTGTFGTTTSTAATITTGTIPTLTAGTTTSTAATITAGTIPTLTAGTTTSTAATITTGTIPTLVATTLITSGTGTAAAPAIVPTGDTNTGIFFPAADTAAIATQGTEAVRIDSSGNVGIGVSPSSRNNTRLQIVDGIGFPATQVASSDANTLDDYEEGTFSPTVIGTTTAGTAAYSVQNARYTKIGRQVFVEIWLNWNSGTGTGNLVISGLPFTSSGADTLPALSIGYYSNVALTVDRTPIAYVATSSVDVYFYTIEPSGGAVAPLAYDAAGTIAVGGAYSV